MSDVNPSTISDISKTLEIELPQQMSLAELKANLAHYIDNLIEKDFDKLIRLLYKIDVNEHLLKLNLQKSQAGAGMVIAEMVLERQLQKTEMKGKFKSQSDIEEDEKW